MWVLYALQLLLVLTKLLTRLILQSGVNSDGWYWMATMAAVFGPLCETEVMTKLMRWTVQSYAIRQVSHDNSIRQNQLRLIYRKG